ncbi:MAG: hypothetical protein VXX42_09795, partial [SAR324 cluster bacterium]|nr:hypothetical protein [SAR324 cluster bacterium]
MVYSAKAAQRKTGDYRDPGISFPITLQIGRWAFSNGLIQCSESGSKKVTVQNALTRKSLPEKEFMVTSA